MRLPIWAAIMAAFLLPASAQHNHHLGHAEGYHDWTSLRAPSSCCNERDCGSLKASEHRETDTGPEILIGGQWCPVLQKHRLTRGKSPDWSTPHACIQIGTPYNTEAPCERLLCYTPAGGF